MIFHTFKNEPIEEYPMRMNNPFDYEPHPLCIKACRELQAYLAKREDWQEEISRGKMFGVLIVERNEPGQDTPQLGYLAAYSGQIGGRSDWEDFVPAVFDYLQPNGIFKIKEAIISNMNLTIKEMEVCEKKVQQLIQPLEGLRKSEIDKLQKNLKEAKAKRDAIRQRSNLTSEEEAELIRESQYMKAEFRRKKRKIEEKTETELIYEKMQEEIRKVKLSRKQRSDNLQRWLFSQFNMLNDKGECKNLIDIFKDTAAKTPPAGSGECCEPKLLQYAYSLGYKPLQMAMFWWGESPKEEIRHHLHFYPACNGKCKPILQWMLPASTFEPAAVDLSIYNKVETLYEDREIAVIHKPEGLLSVPGKDAAQPSVYALMRSKYPEATGPLIVHRLDMATSGLMIIAKTEFAYHRLQKEFLNHRVQKKYIAIISEKEISGKEISGKDIPGKDIPEKGIISLPLLPDYLNRPRQIVNHEQGKEAITEYEILERIDGSHLRIALYPKTGRTHQLRVHCAHQEGLNAPILGDPLYGNEKAARLHLHAEEITFEHPLTGKKITIKRKADF